MVLRIGWSPAHRSSVRGFWRTSLSARKVCAFCAKSASSAGRSSFAAGQQRFHISDPGFVVGREGDRGDFPQALAGEQGRKLGDLVLAGQERDRRAAQARLTPRSWPSTTTRRRNRSLIRSLGYECAGPGKKCRWCRSSKKAQERPWWSLGPKPGWNRSISSTEAFIYKVFSGPGLVDIWAFAMALAGCAFQELEVRTVRVDVPVQVPCRAPVVPVVPVVPVSAWPRTASRRPTA